MLYSFSVKSTFFIVAANVCNVWISAEVEPETCGFLVVFFVNMISLLLLPLK